MMHLHDLDVKHLKDIRGYKPILRAVLRSQIQQLVEQLSEYTGEETVVLSASLTEGTMCHLGSKRAKDFLSGRDEIKSQFLDFCINCETGDEADGVTGVTSEHVSMTTPIVKKKRGRPPNSSKQESFTEKNTALRQTETVKKKQVVKVTLSKSVEGKTTEEVAEAVDRMIAKQIEKSDKKKHTPSSRKSSRNTRSNQSHNASEDSGHPSAGDVKLFSPQLRSGRAVSQKFMDSLANLRGKHHISEKKPEEMMDDSVIDNDGDDDSEMSDSGSVYEQMGDLTQSLLQQVEELATGQHQLEDREIQVVVTEDSDNETPLIKLELEETSLDNDEDLAEFEHDYSNSVDTEASPNTSGYNTLTVKALSVLPGKRSVKPSRKAKEDPDWNRLRRRPKNRLTDKQPHECDVCGVTIMGKNNLTNHKKRIHLKKKDYPCKICGHRFWSAHDRESHALSVHTRQCHACNTYVTESEEWGEGMKKTTIREVVCVCGADVQILSVFGRKRVYMEKETNRRVVNDTKYACGTCGKLFLKRTNCERHQKSHSDVKSHVCYVCGNAYSYENSLYKHLRNEHNISNSICELCGKSFASTMSLNIHISKHHVPQKQELVVPVAQTIQVSELQVATETVPAISQDPNTVAIESEVTEMKVMM